MKQDEREKEKKIWTRVKDDAWEVQDEWENEVQTKDKTSERHNATKHKVNMT